MCAVPVGTVKKRPTGGAKDPEPGTTGWKLRQLRKRLGMRRSDVVAASGTVRTPAGPRLRIHEPAEISKVELNAIGAESEKWRGGLASAYGVTRDDLANYLDDEIDLDELIRRREMRRADPERRTELRDPFLVGAEVALLDGATDADVEAVRAAGFWQREAWSWSRVREEIILVMRDRERITSRPPRAESSRPTPPMLAVVRGVEKVISPEDQRILDKVELGDENNARQVPRKRPKGS